ncbi:hypothetical protein RAZWK3B_19996 [Roseobacter sp. AzwK-3b]|uniref:periplasmic heavy metal sensor n=1 Tax=Roseobacter sp. AzwK-3b TaxID=351016 RepID=UPI00015694A6|nr:periplasmic heavy metal sensor [Roseobacter sp. AzwK-3b]EDM71670.1 hypothetical protein RAZWK3B_19996 [Roseobacter sp. AzwK-3b]
MAQDQEQPKRDTAPMGKWMRGLLVVSLALNLLVAGAVAGHLISGGGGHGRHHAPGIDAAGGPMTRALDERDRRAIARQLREAYRDGRPGRAEQRAAFDALIADLRKTPFDRMAVEGHMARIRGMLVGRLELGQGLLVDRLEGMEPQERAAFADRLEAGWQRGRDR